MRDVPFRIRYTLIGDGSSDLAYLRRILDWTIKDALGIGNMELVGHVADFRNRKSPPKALDERIGAAVVEFPCDIVFVHRDAESVPRIERREEIIAAIRSASRSDCSDSIPVVPVRMTEAWLLISESAIRKASDNPNGKAHLALPNLGRIEGIPDPKELLENLLIQASEKTGRRARQFARDLPKRKHRVAEYIDDFSLLRKLSAFQAFEDETRSVLRCMKP